MNKNTKQTRSALKILFGVFFVFALFFGAEYFLADNREKVFSPTESIIFGNNVLEVEIAKTAEERERGLSRKVFLPENAGLLFLFDAGGKHGIWMKEMLFPIDIIWLDKEGIVVSIAENVLPDSYPFVWKPDAEAWYVLELNAATVERFRIKVGDKGIFGSLPK